MLQKEGSKRPFASTLVKHEAFSKENLVLSIDECSEDEVDESLDKTPISDFNRKYVFNVHGFPKSPTNSIKPKTQDINVRMLDENEIYLPETFEEFNSPSMSPTALPRNKLMTSNAFNLYTKKCD